MRTRYLLALCLVATLAACVPYEGYDEGYYGGYGSYGGYYGAYCPYGYCYPNYYYPYTYYPRAYYYYPSGRYYPGHPGKGGGGEHGHGGGGGGEHGHGGGGGGGGAHGPSLTWYWLPVGHRQRPVLGSYGRGNAGRT